MDDEDRLPEWFPAREADSLTRALDALGWMSRSKFGMELEWAQFWRHKQQTCPRCKGSGHVWSSRQARERALKEWRDLRTAEVRKWLEVSPSTALGVYEWWPPEDPDQVCPGCMGCGTVTRRSRNKKRVPAHDTGKARAGAVEDLRIHSVLMNIGRALRRLARIERLRVQLCVPAAKRLGAPPSGLVLSACLSAYFGPNGRRIDSILPLVRKRVDAQPLLEQAMHAWLDSLYDWSLDALQDMRNSGDARAGSDQERLRPDPRRPADCCAGYEPETAESVGQDPTQTATSLMGRATQEATGCS